MNIVFRGDTRIPRKVNTCVPFVSCRKDSDNNGQRFKKWEIEMFLKIPYMNTTTHVFWCRRCCVSDRFGNMKLYPILSDTGYHFSLYR